MSIFSHLQQFLKADGWLIPEMIHLELWLSSGDSLVTSDHKNPEIGRNSPSEWLLDRILLDQLGAGLEPATQNFVQPIHSLMWNTGLPVRMRVKLRKIKFSTPIAR